MKTKLILLSLIGVSVAHAETVTLMLSPVLPLPSGATV